MDDPSADTFIGRLWRLPGAPARRGRPSRLDVETVVSTAVGLADSDGLEGAALPRVADALGVTAMSLYRHVGSKQELLQLMVDAASEPPSPAPAGIGWRGGLRRWAAELLDLYRRRPWIPRVPIYRSPSGPHQIAWLEHGFSHLADTSLDWGDKLGALSLLSGFVRQSALLSEELAAGRPPGQPQADGEREYGRVLRELVDSAHFPHTAAMLAAAVLDPAEPVPEDSDFSHGLELVLDGLAARIAA